MAGAITMHLDEDFVGIYAFFTENDLQKGMETIPALSEAPPNGLFVLDSNSEKALDVFTNVK